METYGVGELVSNSAECVRVKIPFRHTVFAYKSIAPLTSCAKLDSIKNGGSCAFNIVFVFKFGKRAAVCVNTPVNTLAAFYAAKAVIACVNKQNVKFISGKIASAVFIIICKTLI